MRTDRPSEPVPLTPDELLTTTRAVRRRLDLCRHWPAEVIEQCLEIAIQAPTGGRYCAYHFVVLTDPEVTQRVGAIYRRANQWWLDTYGQRAVDGAGASTLLRFFMDHFEEIPVWVACCVTPLPVDDPDSRLWQFAMLGSIYPATWSFMLALRTRGLGSAFTSIHLRYEDELKEALGVPAMVTIAAMLPVAYYTGEGFRPAKRVPARRRTHWNGW
jgi:nitroreductase